MKVYMVTSGEYSDYGVCGVFSSMEKAQEYMGRPEQFNDVKELEVDSVPPRVWKQMWTVDLDYKGDLTHYYDNRQESRWQEFEEDPGRGSSRAWGPSYDNRGPTFFATSYVSWDHALKLAIECRQKALREHPEWFAVEHGGNR